LWWFGVFQENGAVYWLSVVVGPSSLEPGCFGGFFHPTW